MSSLASAEPGRSVVESEAAATQRLYERYSGRILRFCLKRLGTREEAEDAMQTTFLKAQRGLRRGVIPEFEAAWLYKIAENVCRTRCDRARRRPEASRDIDALQDVLAAPERAEPDLIASLPDAIARMPPAQRRALLLREWQGLTYREIADELGVSESAVETLLYRARRSLTANLEQPERRGRLSRVDLGSLIAFVKSLLTGGAAKVVVAAVAVTAAATTIGAEPQPPVSRTHARPLSDQRVVVEHRSHARSRRAPAVRRAAPSRHRVADAPAVDAATTRPRVSPKEPVSSPPPAATRARSLPAPPPTPPTPAPQPASAQPPNGVAPTLPQSLPTVTTPTVPLPSPSSLSDVASDVASLPSVPVQLPTVTLPQSPALPGP